MWTWTDNQEEKRLYEFWSELFFFYLFVNEEKGMGLWNLKQCDLCWFVPVW